MNPEAFWEMTFGEARRVIEAVVRRRNDEAARQAATAYKLADLITLGISNLFSKHRQQYPSLKEAFPGLIDDDEVQKDWRTTRDRFREAFNNTKIRR